MPIRNGASRRIWDRKCPPDRSIRRLQLLAVLAVAATTAASAPEPAVAASIPASAPRVLVLYSDDRLLPANVLFDESFRQALAADSVTAPECFSEYLDAERFPTGYLQRMETFLQAKYDPRPPHAVVAFAATSLDFCLRSRDRLFAGVPIVFAAVGGGDVAGSNLGPNVTGVLSSFDGPATLRLALRLHPRTQQVYVVESTSQLHRPSQSTFREPEFHTRFHYLASEPLPDLLATLATLPANSLVIDLSLFPSREHAQRVARAAHVPIYAAYDPIAGHGLVGAVTTPMAVIGEETARLVGEILRRGERGELPAARTLAATPIFDWRELKRWGLRERQLPDGSVVQFKPPSLWQQHSTLMITVGALFVLQSGLILALVLQSRRRARAEREARRRRQELEHMTRVATMGELTASLAHEINQPLTAILSNAQAAQRLIAAGGTEVQGEIQEILADIAADDQRASEVIRRMRALLRKGESEPIVLDVNDVVAEVVGLVHGEMILHNVALRLELSLVPARVHGDRVQLQQVLLNLMMNAIDAMKDTANGNRRVIVRSAAANGVVRVSVEDSGGGVAADKGEQVFEPFVTTKAHGLGLGLAICRSIIQAHGGRIGFDSNLDHGATFWFTLPAVDGGNA